MSHPPNTTAITDSDWFKHRANDEGYVRATTSTGAAARRVVPTAANVYRAEQGTVYVDLIVEGYGHEPLAVRLPLDKLRQAAAHGESPVDFDAYGEPVFADAESPAPSAKSP